MDRVKIIHRNKVISLRRSDHVVLLERFKSSNFRKDKHGYYANETPCSLCVRYNEDGTTDCEGCTLRKFSTTHAYGSSLGDDVGCVKVMKDLLGTDPWPFYLTQKSVRLWHDKINEAKANMQKIYEFMQSAR